MLEWSHPPLSDIDGVIAWSHMKIVIFEMSQTCFQGIQNQLQCKNVHVIKMYQQILKLDASLKIPSRCINLPIPAVVFFYVSQYFSKTFEVHYVLV